MCCIANAFMLLAIHFSPTVIRQKKTSVNIHDFIEKKYMIQKMIKHMQALI